MDLDFAEGDFGREILAGPIYKSLSALWRGCDHLGASLRLDSIISDDFSTEID